MGYSQGEPAQYSSDFQSLQKAKRSGSYVPAPVPVVQWSEELFAEVENPTVWTPAEHLDWKVKFQYPSSWNIVDPVVEGNRFIRTVRTGFRHRDQHIFCTCELSIVITKLSDQFKSPDDFFDEVRILNTAASPDDSQESLTTMDGHPAIVTTNTFLQEDGTLTRVIDKHAFLPQARLGISVVAFFADSDTYFAKYRRVANAFFESIRLTETFSRSNQPEPQDLPDDRAAGADDDP